MEPEVELSVPCLNHGSQVTYFHSSLCSNICTSLCQTRWAIKRMEERNGRSRRTWEHSTEQNCPPRFPRYCYYRDTKRKGERVKIFPLQPLQVVHHHLCHQKWNWHSHLANIVHTKKKRKKMNQEAAKSKERSQREMRGEEKFLRGALLTCDFVNEPPNYGWWRYVHVVHEKEREEEEEKDNEDGNRKEGEPVVNSCHWSLGIQTQSSDAITSNWICSRQRGEKGIEREVVVRVTTWIKLTREEGKRNEYICIYRWVTI